MSRSIVASLIAAALLSAPVATAVAQTPTTPAPAPAAKPEGKPAMGEAREVRARGTISAIDKEKSTVTLKGEKGRTITLHVQDPAKLDVLKVGDPVVGTYIEAIAIEVKKAGSGTPGATVEERRAGSKPGENPAGVVARQISVTATVTAVNKQAPSVTIKGPGGKVETVKVQDAKNLANVKAGDLVEITYMQALAVALDKPAPKAAPKATK
jgi:Cu/Ag efflux protein CusF